MYSYSQCGGPILALQSMVAMKHQRQYFFKERERIKMRLTLETLSDSNISIRHFAELINSDGLTVKRYLNHSKSQRISSIRKIELGADVLIFNNLVWPNLDYTPNTKSEKSFSKNKKISYELDAKFRDDYAKREREGKLL